MYVKASEFKAKCLSMIDALPHSGEPVIITKHGRPVAKLVPYSAGGNSLFGFLRGQVSYKGKRLPPEAHEDWSGWNEERNLRPAK